MDGLLDRSQIRGINPDYSYTYKPFPRMIYPPLVIVIDATQEKKLRTKWNQPLPWAAQQMKERDEYYALQDYPKEMQPPGVVVNNADEEAAVKASWNVGNGVAIREDWPRYMFHATKGGKMVRDAAEMQALGPGWYETPEEAVKAAAANVPAAVAVSEPEVETGETPDPDKMTRSQLFAFLKTKGVTAQVPISNDELRDRAKAALAA
jgi:hypothetical protein